MSTPQVAGVCLLEMQRQIAANGGPGYIPVPSSVVANVLVMATQNWINIGHSGQVLPLLFSDEGLTPVAQPPPNSAPFDQAPPPPPPRSSGALPAGEPGPGTALPVLGAPIGRHGPDGLAVLYLGPRVYRGRCLFAGELVYII